MKIILNKTANLFIPGIIFFVVGCSKSNSTPSTPTLSTDQKTLTIGAASNSKDTFKIVSSSAWTASSDQTWLTLSATSGNGNASIVTTATVNFGDSTSRTANITITATGLPNQTIAVTQQAGIIVVAGNGIKGSGLNQLSLPYGIFVDNSKNLYVADLLNHRIMKWAPAATQGAIVAGDGTPGSSLNQLNSPSGVSVDNLGNIYISDEYNLRAVKWTPGATQGTIVAVTDTSMNNYTTQPLAIFVDGNGNIFLSEQDAQNKCLNGLREIYGAP